MVEPVYFLVLAAVVFVLALFGFLTRRSLVQALMCLELMMSAVALTFVTLSSAIGDKTDTGVVFALFCLVVAAAEFGMGLALILLYFRKHGSATADELNLLKG